MLPLTTRLAPSSRRAEVGSEILRWRTSVEGTTQSDLPPTSRSESFPVRLSIRPSARASLAGLLPILSKGRTAMCFSEEPTKAAVMRARKDGTAKATAATSSTAAGTSHQRERGRWPVAAGQELAEAWLKYFCISAAEMVAVGAVWSMG